jgi:hypothetical protein
MFLMIHLIPKFHPFQKNQKFLMIPKNQMFR